jgi:geranylgeranyl pyrophosphate synthase
VRDNLKDRLEKLWFSSDAWPDYIQVMRLALNTDQTNDAAPGLGSSRLAVLPGLCCQAAGGEQDWADNLTLAWLLFYASAQLLDSVEDDDEPGAWWVGRGASVALSAFSGLYFSASLALNAIAQHPATRMQSAEIAEDFYRTFLVMGSGQHADLTLTVLTLDQYWQQAETKSGVFFSLACRAGARLATSEADAIENYAQYGHNLGMLIQITDDLEDVFPPPGSTTHGQRSQFARSLPVVYAQEVLPPLQAERLRICLQAAPDDVGAAQEAVSLVDQSNAAAYVMIEIERYKQESMKALERANPRAPAGEALAKIIQEI